MNQSSKDRYLSQKGVSRDKAGAASVPGKKALAPLEKLVLLLVFIFLVASPLAFLVNKEIMVYVGLINYFILGLAIAVKPDLVIEIMRKNRAKFDEIYSQRMGKLNFTIRAFGLVFIAVGAVFLYLLVLQA